MSKVVDTFWYTDETRGFEDGTPAPSILSWRGYCPTFISEGGRSGLSFAFGVHVDPSRNFLEDTQIQISIRGVSVDGRKWAHNMSIPFTNEGRRNLWAANQQKEFRRPAAYIDPCVWMLYPEIINMPDQNNAYLVDYRVPYYGYRCTDLHGHIEDDINLTYCLSFLNQKTFNPDTGDLTLNFQDQVIQNKIRTNFCHIYDPATGNPGFNGSSWTFLAGHIADHGDGFLTVNGLAPKLSYGASGTFADRPLGHNKENRVSFLNLDPGYLQVDFEIIGNCSGGRSNTTHGITISNIWVGLTELYDREQAWMDALYDRENRTLIDAGNGTINVGNGQLVKPMLYVVDDFVNRIDGSPLDVTRLTPDKFNINKSLYFHRDFFTSVTDAPVKGNLVALNKARNYCFIRPNPGWTSNTTINDSYYDAVSTDLGYRPTQAILPLHSSAKFGEFFLAMVLNDMPYFQIQIFSNYSDPETIGIKDQQKYQPGEMLFLEIWPGVGTPTSPGVYPTTLNVSIQYGILYGGKRTGDIGDRWECHLVNRPDFAITAEGKLRLMCLYFNSASVKMEYSSGLDMPPQAAVFEMDNGLVTQTMKEAQFYGIANPLMMPYLRGTSAHISMYERSRRSQGSIMLPWSTMLGGLWLYDKNTIKTNPSVPWNMLREDHGMDLNFSKLVDPANGVYEMLDTGPYGMSHAGGSLHGIRPSLYIDPSVGLHCNAAYSAMQLGDSMTPNFERQAIPDIQTYSASSGGYSIHCYPQLKLNSTKLKMDADPSLSA